MTARLILRRLGVFARENACVRQGMHSRMRCDKEAVAFPMEMPMRCDKEAVAFPIEMPMGISDGNADSHARMHACDKACILACDATRRPWHFRWKCRWAFPMLAARRFSANRLAHHALQCIENGEKESVVGISDVGCTSLFRLTCQRTMH